MTDHHETPDHQPVWARERARKRGGPTFKGLIVNTLGLAVVAAILAFFAAPAVGFFAIRSAADSNDVQALGQLIDFNAVRGSLRPQLSDRPEALTPAPSFMEDPIGAVRRQFETHPVVGGPNVDAYLTPVALSALTRGEGRYAVTTASGGKSDLWPTPVYWSVNRARMSVADEGGSRTVFTFERRGPYEWRLVHIGLPEGATPTVPAPTAPPAKK